jgi:hypothetical protein
MNKKEAQRIADELSKLGADGPNDHSSPGFYDISPVRNERDLIGREGAHVWWHVEVQLYVRYLDTPRRWRDEIKWNLRIPFQLMDYAVRAGLSVQVSNMKNSGERAVVELNDRDVKDDRKRVDAVSYTARWVDTGGSPDGP